MRARKKPFVIEYIRWFGDNLDEVFNFVGLKVNTVDKDLIISTLEGKMKADIGDYIIKGVKGEFYPCKPDIFEMTYDILKD